MIGRWTDVKREIPEYPRRILKRKSPGPGDGLHGRPRGREVTGWLRILTGTAGWQVVPSAERAKNDRRLAGFWVRGAEEIPKHPRLQDVWFGVRGGVSAGESWELKCRRGHECSSPA